MKKIRAGCNDLDGLWHRDDHGTSSNCSGVGYDRSMATTTEEARVLRYTVVIESTREPEHPGWYYAHVPALDLTTHGEGVEGALESRRHLIGGRRPTRYRYLWPTSRCYN